jgi:hypothetical protein
MRQPRDGEDLLDAVELSGATCRSLSGSLTLTGGGTDAERFTARILAATANKSSADTARRVADARERLAGQSWHGGQRPFGYRHDPDAPKYHKTLITDQDEAKVIRDAATAILAEGDEKISLKAIARDLRDRGVPTVTGTAWTASTLRDILVKPTVAGIVISGGAELAAPWPAIIEPDRWRRLRDTLTDPGRRTNGQTGNAPRWLVSKMALCGICADGKATVHATSGGGRPAAYRCDALNHLWRDAAHVDEYVAAVVVERLSRPDVAGLLRPPPRPGTNTAALRAEARKLHDRKRAQMRMHAAGAIDDGDLAAGMKEIRARLAQIDAQLAVSDQPDPLAEFRDRPAAAVWESLPLPRRRAVVRLLATVTILPAGRKGRGFDPSTVRVEPRTL